MNHYGMEPLFRPPVAPSSPPVEDFQPGYRIKRRRKKPAVPPILVKFLFALGGAVAAYFIAREIAPYLGGYLP
jgi:hypothetical protein